MTKKEKTEEFLNHFFEYFRIRPTILVKEEGEDLEVQIEGAHLNYLIGFRGESLDSLQNILNIYLYHSFGEQTNTAVDINNYRQQRKEKLEGIARSFIDKARGLGDSVELPPMKPFERRLIHMFVAEYPDVESTSVGEGYDRRVVIKPILDN